MSGKDKQELQGRVNVAQLTSLLKQAIPALESGSMHINWAGHSIELHPSEDINFSMQISTKKDKEKILLELSWTKFTPA